MYRTGILSVLFSLAAIVAFSQSYQGSISRVNDYTRQYDPYKRVFTYNESNRKLSWVTADGDITCEVNINAVSIITEPAGSDFYVTLTCSDNTDCIYCNYGGNTKISSITVTSSSAAVEIVKELQSISGNGGSPAAAVAAIPPSSGGGSSAVVRINELCRQYDPYVRTFTFDDKTGKLTWIDNDGEITCSAKVEDITMSVQANPSDFSVVFTCNRKSKCIDSNYGGATDETAITISNKAAADEVVQKINSLKQ